MTFNRSPKPNPFYKALSIRTVKDWNSLPQSVVVSAGSLALFKSRLSSHVAL